MPLRDLLTITLPDSSTHEIKWVKSPRSRALRLSLTTHGLRVSTPQRAPRSVVEKFILSQASWIQAHLKLRPQLSPNTLLYLGQPYQVIVKNELGEPHQRIEIHGDHFYLLPVSFSAESAQLLLERWLRTKATELCTPLLQELAKKMGVEVPALRFREAHTRWGSCAHDGVIMLNWRLIHTPEEVARYVVIHELAHRVHLNHSSAFWNLVEQFDPDYRLHRGWLKRHGQLCRTPEIVITPNS